MNPDQPRYIIIHIIIDELLTEKQSIQLPQEAERDPDVWQPPTPDANTSKYGRSGGSRKEALPKWANQSTRQSQQ